LTVLIARRLAAMAVTLALVSVLVFVLAQLLPGDVGRTVLGPFASNAQVAAYDRSIGLDRPLAGRYLGWAGDFLTGRWGTSPVLQQAVRPYVLGALGRSTLLALVTFAIVVPVALVLGVAAASRRGSRLDRFITVGSMGVAGVPEMVSAVILTLLLGVDLHWLPVSASSDGPLPDRLYHLVLPALALAPTLAGYLARMVRATAVEVMDADYTRTAVLKGLPPGRVLLRHVTPNALGPTTAVLGVQTGWLIGGLVIVEQLFAYPGIGRELLQAVNAHDVTVIEAATLVTAILGMLANLGADLLVIAITPRLRLRRS
jgi:peptide/nickel transport system permease protein